ncbi:hypothetical protein BKA93DRAFT_829148 [Sparassis latifolia]
MDPEPPAPPAIQPRLLSDPGLEVCPDFSSPLYNLMVEAFSHSQNIAQIEAIHQLVDAWKLENDARKEAWALQLQADRDIEAAAEVQHLAAQEAQQLAELELAEAERKEAEKKKPKIGNFTENEAPPDFISARPSAYTLEKVRKFEYVELWYFLKEGWDDAYEAQHSTADDAFSITCVENVMALKPIMSSRASRNIVKDQDLTWRQMSMAKAQYLFEIRKADWPPKHYTTILNFFFALENHEYRRCDNGEISLLHYQA